MMIPVLGMDPSLRNWGLASANFDPATGLLYDLTLSVIQPKETTGKQVRKNSKDLEIARLLSEGLVAPVRAAKVIFVEVPVGSQSSRAMASYGVCVGILGALQAQGFQIIEVTASEVKKAMTGYKEASKNDMIAASLARYPLTNWPLQKNGEVVSSKAEHMADAIGAINAGIKLPTFQNLLRLLAATT